MTRRDKKLSEGAWTALTEALSCYHWYKQPFENLVRGRFADTPELLGQLNFSEPKRKVVSHLVSLLRANEAKYASLVIEALLGLAEVDPDFRALARETEDPDRLTDARSAHDLVVEVTKSFASHIRSQERIQSEQNRMAEAERVRGAHYEKLSHLKSEFLAMSMPGVDTHQRGTDLEHLLNRLFNLHDLEPRASYSLKHSQIDGAFNFQTDDYLLEARWWNEPLQPKHLSDFRYKVDGKAKNTLGLCIAIGGFTEGAVTEHSRNGTPLILMDGSDLMTILDGLIELPVVLEKKRRHAAETGVAFLPIGKIT